MTLASDSNCSSTFGGSCLERDSLFIQALCGGGLYWPSDTLRAVLELYERQRARHGGHTEAGAVGLGSSGHWRLKRPCRGGKEGHGPRCPEDMKLKVKSLMAEDYVLFYVFSELLVLYIDIAF